MQAVTQSNILNTHTSRTCMLYVCVDHMRPWMDDFDFDLGSILPIFHRSSCDSLHGMNINARTPRTRQSIKDLLTRINNPAGTIIKQVLICISTTAGRARCKYRSTTTISAVCEFYPRPPEPLRPAQKRILENICAHSDRHSFMSGCSYTHPVFVLLDAHCATVQAS